MIAPHGRCILLAALAPLTVLACASGKPAQPKSNADGSMAALVEDMQASAAARRRRPSEADCAVWTQEGDALLAAGKREEAIASYDRTRNRCIGYAPVRRQLYLARRPADQPPPATPTRAQVYLGVVIDSQLGPDLAIAESSAFLDGLALWEYENTPLPVGGVQELHVELWLLAGDRRSPDVEATLVDIRQSVIVHPSRTDRRPLLGTAVVHVRDRQDGKPIAQRLQFEVEVRPLKPVTELTDRAALMGRAEGLRPVMLSPNQGSSLRLTDAQNTMPAELRARQFWALEKICVGFDGLVERVSTIKPAQAVAENSLHAWMKQWKYRPYATEGIPRRYCTPVRIEVSPGTN
jgi:hypothetical protein